MLEGWSGGYVGRGPKQSPRCESGACLVVVVEKILYLAGYSKLGAGVPFHFALLLLIFK